MTEQSRQPSGVQENSAVLALDASASDVRHWDALNLAISAHWQAMCG